MTAELLASLAGALISLAAAYLPGFSRWFEGLDGVHKRLVLLGALLVAALAASLGQAAQDRLPADVWNLAQAFLAALLANQATYLLARND